MRDILFMNDKQMALFIRQSKGVIPDKIEIFCKTTQLVQFGARRDSDWRFMMMRHSENYGHNR